LPRSYNPRLDAAAPGLFTALGIIGTFVGLIVGFLRVDATRATESVSPLLGGMVVAFVNSLLGVLLSVIWTVGSRTRRHSFDVSVLELADQLTARAPRESYEHRVLIALKDLHQTFGSGFGELNAGLKTLQNSTSQSSRVLLVSLSTRLGEALQGLVSMPFDRLNATVESFDRIVKTSVERQESLSQQLDSAAKRLSEAEESLTSALSLAKACIEEFTVASLQLRDNAAAAAEVVTAAQRAVSDLAGVSSDVRSAAERYAAVADTLGTVVTGVQALADALRASSADFAAATNHLDAAVATIRDSSDETVRQSVTAVRSELHEALAGVAASLRTVGEQTISAYEASSQRVAAAVDGKMSDLTDRLSAELTTLASRLPAEVESLNNAMGLIRTQIQRATRSMDAAAQELAHRTPEALHKQFEEYDKALARAMDHFSGTLESWDAKIGVIQEFSVDLRRWAATQPNVPASIAILPAPGAPVSPA
jgi:chromosome segregation ATPase